MYSPPDINKQLDCPPPMQPCSQPHPVYTYKAPPYTKSSTKDDRKMFGPNNMIHARNEEHVWPNSHPRGRGGHDKIHNCNMEDHTN